ncbi:hypothetical protein LINGRAHAP2_LOCUS26997, partial [Linum grandiflorum]
IRFNFNDRNFHYVFSLYSQTKYDFTLHPSLYIVVSSSDHHRFQAMATKITATCYKNYISVWSLSCRLPIETVGIDENSSDMIQS